MATYSMKKSANGYCVVDKSVVAIPIEYISSPFEENNGERTYIRNSNQCSCLVDEHCSLGKECEIYKNAPVEYKERLGRKQAASFAKHSYFDQTKAYDACTQNKTKGLFAKRKPYYQNESRAIVLLCTHRSEWVHFLYAVFQMIFIPVMAAEELCWNNSYSRVHLPFRIRNLQEHKEKD